MSKLEWTSGVVDFNGEPRFISLAYTRDPNSDQWNLYNKSDEPAMALRMPKDWQPSKEMRVNGVLGK